MPGPDYHRLIDAPTWAFIRRTADSYPTDTICLTVADQRAIYDRMCRRFHHGHPPGTTATGLTLAGRPARRYRADPARQTVLYLHGGGFVVGGLDSHDDICAEIADQTGYEVVSLDYRLAPEHFHPAAFDDSLAAAREIAADGPLILAGDSSGGCLAASVAHAMRGDPRLLGQVLIYPGLGGDRTRGSYVTHAEAPMLTTADVAHYARIRHNGGEGAGDPTALPLHDTDFTGLPPTVIFSAECDPMADDGRDYRDRILAAGGQARWHPETGLVHGYLRARHDVPRAKAGFRRIIQAMEEMGEPP